MAALDFIFDVNNPSREQLIESYFGTATYSANSQVRNDKSLAVTIQPVTLDADGSSIYAPDWLASDTFQLSIGLPDEPASGGTFKLTVNGSTTGMTVLDYNITAANLQTPVSAAFVAAGKAACTITLLATGVYQIVGNSNGAITTGFVVGDGANLTPAASAFIVEDSLGSASTPYKLLLVVRQSPMCFAAPATALTTAGVTVSTNQSGSSTANKVQKVAFDAANTHDGTFRISAIAGSQVQILSNTVANPTVVTTATAHGFVSGDSINIPSNNGSTPTIAGTRTVTKISDTTFSIAVNVTVAGTVGICEKDVTQTCGVFTPTMSARDFALQLAGHPQIYYGESDGTADNISVTKTGQDFIVEFTGTLGLSDTPALTATNIDLVAPQGVSGTINLNTIALYKYSIEQTTDTFELQVSITRTRASGEVRTIFGPTSITIAKELVDPLTMVPTPLPSYYTSAQTDLYFAHWNSSITGYTGGGGTNLDGLTTTTITVPVLYFFNHATDGARGYRLIAGTTAESSPDIIRPDDYNASTNAKIWTSYL